MKMTELLSLKEYLFTLVCDICSGISVPESRLFNPIAERPKMYIILAFLSAIGLKIYSLVGNINMIR